MASYETKAILVAIGKIISKSDSLEEAYEAVVEVANVEGAILRPYYLDKDEDEDDDEEDNDYDDDDQEETSRLYITNDIADLFGVSNPFQNLFRNNKLNNEDLDEYDDDDDEDEED